MSNPSFFCKELQAITTKFSPTTMVESSQGALLFTEYGARLLGLFPRRDLPNVLWNPANLDEVMASKLWAIGGERLWLSPERTFYYDNPRDFEGWFTPSEMDPGHYTTIGSLQYQSNFAAFDCVMNESYEGCSAERIFKIHETDPFSTGLAHAGTTITDTMVIGVTHIDMCAWSLAMVFTNGLSSPGTALFPIKPNASVLSYFTPIPADRVSVEAGYARYKIDAQDIYKLAIRPEDMCFDNPVKAVYVSAYPDSDTWFCVIKSTNDMPRSQEECVDPAKGNPDGPKGGIQSYNAGPAPSGEHLLFGEIELQLVKGIEKDQTTISKATHTIDAYAGTKAEILAVAKKALRLNTVPVIY